MGKFCRNECRWFICAFWRRGNHRPGLIDVIAVDACRVNSRPFSMVVVSMYLRSSESDAVDIHFVHGLTGDREKTWKTKKAVALCLRGLVCEDTLTTVQQRPENHLKQVFYCTRGIVFLGTPHYGSGLAHWAESLAKAIGVLK
ncbi:hypothetical protein GJ744_009655 [Endocarpon pusillum]|uniref:Uncharacterized protein n=1 Tax=Endocarpon pusillum TaxID=364733 RepID=A0A8H7AFM6_9EURO|nr:hypothetical protein GJ744_009655 [Endocarpon pusillum]